VLCCAVPLSRCPRPVLCSRCAVCPFQPLGKAFRISGLPQRRGEQEKDKTGDKRCPPLPPCLPLPPSPLSSLWVPSTKVRSIDSGVFSAKGAGRRGQPVLPPRAAAGGTRGRACQTSVRPPDAIALLSPLATAGAVRPPSTAHRFSTHTQRPAHSTRGQTGRTDAGSDGAVQLLLAPCNPPLSGSSVGSWWKGRAGAGCSGTDRTLGLHVCARQTGESNATFFSADPPAQQAERTCHPLKPSWDRAVGWPRALGQAADKPQATGHGAEQQAGKRQRQSHAE